MRTFIKLGSLALTASLTFGFGCGSDDDSSNDSGSDAGGTGGTSDGGNGGSGDGGTTSSTTASDGGSGGTSDGGTTSSSTTASDGGSGGTSAGGTTSTGGSAGGGSGGAPPDEAPYTNDDCTEAGGPAEAVTGSGVGAFVDSDDWHAGWTNFSTDSSGEDLCSGALSDIEVEADGTLSEDEVTLTAEDGPYELSTQVHVADGQTLTIEPGAVFCGGPEGSLIVARGGTIEAEGTADEPIIFTSIADEGDKRAGDWGGVILLGKAGNFKGDAVLIEGLDEEERNMHGGDDDDDNSGTLAYVRIEFGGTEITPMNEINGLTLGSVGSGTTIHHIAVNTTLDDCFEWFGGSVNVDHLVCYNAGDDMFDADQGFRGTLDTLLGIDVAPLSSDPNGFEMDSDLAGATPVTDITASNVTLCGTGQEEAALTYGMLLREKVEGTFSNIVISGFDAAVDTRDDFGSAASPHVTIENSLMFEGLVHSVAYDETETEDSASPSYDDDEGFDERAWFADGEGNISYE